MATSISHREAETIALGRAWGLEAEPGWVVGLTGPLGAGKTQIARGLAQGLQIAARVRSPTFGLAHEYVGGRCVLFHLDLYRLETPAQLGSADLDEYLFSPRGVTVIEWFERWPGGETLVPAGVPGARLRRVTIEIVDETTRRIAYEDSGA
jgi:tRNA threonylcarbamoyladenosine biosynthesis protein TsaE